MDLVFAGAAAASTVVGIAYVGIAYSYKNWQRKKVALLRSNSQVVETARGPIECAILGEGPAVLVIHGCPGGYDQGLVAARLTSNKKFKFIALSRPGYLRTPLEVGDTPEAQADAYAALLDALEISKAAIMGISGGGPSALQFALRHPGRCWGLLAVSAISHRLSLAEIANCKSLLRRIFFTIGLGYELAWNLVLLMAKKCRILLASMISKNPDYEAQESNQQESLNLISGLLRTFSMLSMRKAGLQNDMIQLTTMPMYPLEKIAAPTLVLHGRGDELVPFSHARFIADAVPQSTLLDIEGGGHLFFTTHKQLVVSAVNDFLNLSARKATFESQALKTDKTDQSMGIR